MKDTILLVGHGSRAQAGNEEILRFARLWQSRHPDWRIETCFIEFCNPLLGQGMSQAAQGSDRVLVVPLILNAAGHVRMDIPLAIKAAQKRHPEVQFLYAPNLAVCDPLLRILKRFLRQAMLTLDVPDPQTTGLILLGRGSSDRLANGEIAKMARWVHEISQHERVDLAFTGVTFPRLEKVVQDQVRLGMMQIIVMPYYLFTGTLIQRIERQMQRLAAQYPQIRFTHTPYFGFEEEIFQLLDQRVHDMKTSGRGLDLDALMQPDPMSRQGGHHHHHHHGHGHDDHHHHAHHHHDDGDGHHHDHHHHDDGNGHHHAHHHDESDGHHHHGQHHHGNGHEHGQHHHHGNEHQDAQACAHHHEQEHGHPHRGTEHAHGCGHHDDETPRHHHHAHHAGSHAHAHHASEGIHR